MCKTVIAKTNEISHEDWLKLRQKGIGGSDSAAVCGFDQRGIFASCGLESADLPVYFCQQTVSFYDRKH